MPPSYLQRSVVRSTSRNVLTTSRTSPSPVFPHSRLHTPLFLLPRPRSFRPHSTNRLYLPVSFRFPPAHRTFTSTCSRRHGHIEPPKPGEERRITFIDKEGDSHTFEVGDGDNLLDIAQANDLEMEGACGGSCACSTCHVIVESDAFYDAIPEPSDDENDMLDLAFGLTETSRLGCQVKMAPELDGVVVRLPSMTRNMQASDFAKKGSESQVEGEDRKS